jgi:hypothetical protein
VSVAAVIIASKDSSGVSLYFEGEMSSHSVRLSLRRGKTGKVRIVMRHSLCNPGNRSYILLTAVRSRVFLVPALKLFAPVLFFSPAQKGGLYRRTVLSSRHGQFGPPRGLQDL